MNPAEILRAMAERIARIDEAEFAGCIVVIPPAAPAGSQMANDPIEDLYINPHPDPNYFWGASKMRFDARQAEFAESLRNRDPWR